MDEIEIIFTCGCRFKRERHDLGTIDPSPINCDCRGCWPEDTKDLNLYRSYYEEKGYPIQSLYCPKCKQKWYEDHGFPSGKVEVVLTHTCGHSFKYWRDPLWFKEVSKDGKRYGSHPFECRDCIVPYENDRVVLFPGLIEEIP